MAAKKRIALYGGTFDPVHLGHVAIATRVSALFEIDELLFIPAQLAPHKLTQEVTLALHRHAMLVLATQHNARLRVSTYELEAPNRSYTVDTLAYFQARLGESAELFFVMGADSWSEITTWREWRRLLSLAHQIVITRPGFDISFAEVGAGVQFADLRGATSLPDSGKGEGKKVLITDAVKMEISATEIRQAAREEQFARLAELVPTSVAEYIIKYQLYRETNESKLNG